VRIPYFFISQQRGIEVEVCVETHENSEHYVVTCGRLVLENRPLHLEDLCWSDEEFERWAAQTKEAWLKVLPMAKLIM
jgi:hypothetical protein